MEISELTLFCVKGCGGISLDRSQVTHLGVATPNGLIRDRSWVIVKAEDGRFITQRQVSKVAQIQPALSAPALLVDPSIATFGDEDALVLTAPAMKNPLRIPLKPRTQLKPIDITVWSWNGMALDEGEEASSWLTEFLGIPARLARHAGPDASGSFLRNVQDAWGGPEGGMRTAFADAYPFLLGSETSMADLNAQIPAARASPIPIDRFRPNICVRGAPEPWEEDLWDEVEVVAQNQSIASEPTASDAVVLFKALKPRTRCNVPSIDQKTGLAAEDGEPVTTLHRVRSGASLDWLSAPHNLPKSMKHATFFGASLMCLKGEGTIVHVGDKVEVVSRKTIV